MRTHTQSLVKKIFEINFVIEGWILDNWIFILSPGSCPRGGTLGHWGSPRGQKFIFFKHGHMAYQIDEDDGHYRTQVKFSSYGQTDDLGARSKGQISSNFRYRVNFNDFIPNFVCVLANKR